MVKLETLRIQKEGESLFSQHVATGSHGTFLVNSSQRPDLAGLAPDIYYFQGILQNPNDPGVVKIQKALLERLKVASVTTVGNNGMGIPGGRDTANRSQTANDRLELLRYLAGDSGGLAVGASLGTQTVTDVLASSKEPLPVSGVVQLAPGMMRPEYARQGANDLPVNLLQTTLRYLRHHHEHIFGSTRDIYQTLGHVTLHTQPALHHRGLIMRGTPPEYIAAVAAQYPMTVVGGNEDAVFDAPMWRALAAQTNRITLEEIPGRGHELVFVPELAVRAICNSLQNLPRKPIEPAA